MKLPHLPRKRILLPALATAAVLAVGGTVGVAAAGDDVPRTERDRIAGAATAAVGGGTAVDVETSDDRGEAYEVEVRAADGSEIEVTLDDDLGVVAEDHDRSGSDLPRTDGEGSGEESGPDDAPLSDAVRASVEQAALAAVGGGTVLDVEASDDSGRAYEVEVRDTAGTSWDVDLDADLQVVGTAADD